QGAGEECHSGLVRIDAAETHRPRDGQRRGPLCALRAVRGTLPDGRVGHAEIPRELAACRGRSGRHRGQDAQERLISDMDRTNDFAIKIATVNGTGSASANTLLMKSIFRSGIPVMGKNYFPSNIQGLPTWYEIRVTKDAYVARSGKIDVMVAM